MSSKASATVLICKLSILRQPFDAFILARHFPLNILLILIDPAVFKKREDKTALIVLHFHTQKTIARHNKLTMIPKFVTSKV